jgi:hypothetical protein
MNKKKANFSLGEDWWAVIIAFLLVLLSALGLLGENGLFIPF